MTVGVALGVVTPVARFLRVVAGTLLVSEYIVPLDSQGSLSRYGRPHPGHGSPATYFSQVSIGTSQRVASLVRSASRCALSACLVGSKGQQGSPRFSYSAISTMLCRYDKPPTTVSWGAPGAPRLDRDQSPRVSAGHEGAQGALDPTRIDTRVHHSAADQQR